MGTYNVSVSGHGAYAKTLGSGTVDTVVFARDIERIEVMSDGTAAVYVTVDGTAPTVAGDHTFELPAGAANVREISVPTAQNPQDGPTTVKLVSAGTPKYSVSEASS